MKIPILLLLTSLSLSAATVEVISPTSVKVDGTNFGSVADTIANNPKLASDVQRALEKWVTASETAHSTALKAKDDSSKITTDKAAADTKAAADKATAAEQEQARLLAVAESIKSAAKIEDAKALADQAIKPKADRELAELKAKKAEIEAEIAEREARVTAKKAGK